jgi:hypothetical protein
MVSDQVQVVGDPAGAVQPGAHRTPAEHAPADPASESANPVSIVSFPGGGEAADHHPGSGIRSREVDGSRQKPTSVDYLRPGPRSPGRSKLGFQKLGAPAVCRGCRMWLNVPPVARPGWSACRNAGPGGRRWTTAAARATTMDHCCPRHRAGSRPGARRERGDPRHVLRRRVLLPTVIGLAIAIAALVVCGSLGAIRNTPRASSAAAPRQLPAAPRRMPSEYPPALRRAADSSPAAAITSSTRPAFSLWERASHSRWCARCGSAAARPRPAATRRAAAGSAASGTGGRRWWRSWDRGAAASGCAASVRGHIFVVEA